MLSLKKFGLAAILATSLISTGCIEDKSEYLEGTVIREFSTKQKYALQIKTAKGVYTVSFYPKSADCSLETLNFAINEGSKVKFMTKAKNGYNFFYRPDKIGELGTHQIEVLDIDKEG